MSNYATLISSVQSVIDQNGNNEITGPILQQTLISIINSLGRGYQFIGIATPETNPGTPDQRVFYLASSGTYPNFGPATIPAGYIGVLYYDTSWHYNLFDLKAKFASGEEVNEVHIVKDLTTGGAGDVLSAEQGRVIGGVLFGTQYISTIIRLSQYNPTRLSSDVFRTVDLKELLSKFWLSDDVNYSCTLFGNDINNYTGSTQLVGWGGTKEQVQSAILSCSYTYFFLFFCKGDGTASISPSELELEGEIDTNDTIRLSQYNPTRLSSDVFRTVDLKELLSKFWLSDDVNYSCTLFGNDINNYTGSTQLVGWGGTKEQVQSAILSCSYTYFFLFFRKGDGTASISPSELRLSPDLEDVETGLVNEVNHITQLLSKEDYTSFSNFLVSVDTNVANVVDNNLTLQDSQVFESDNGRIYLPTSYLPMGDKTRLIIHCHGASQNYNDGSIFPKTSSLVTIDYLLAKGYAVLDVNGLPGTHSFYATTIGNPIAYRSYVKAYEWAVNNFNLYKEIFVVGISAGSIPALQISQIGTIPVLACVTYCGIMDFTRGWMLLGGYHPNNQGPAIKAYLATKFGFTGTQPTLGNVDPCSDDEWKYLVDNVEKFSGWNPYTNGITSTMTMEEYRAILSTIYGDNPPSWIDSDYEFESVQQMLMAFKIPQRTTTGYESKIAQEQKLFDTCSIHRRVPLKIFHATNDNVAPYRYSRYYYEMCKRGGSTVEMRTFASGGHNPTGNTQSVVVNGVTISTNVLSIEVLDWLQRFEN